MIAAAPTTCAPAARATSIVSRVEPPVVTTSSTTRTCSPGASVKPRRSISLPSCRSAKMARTPSARPTSCPMTMPPSAGDRTTCAPRLAHAVGDVRSAGLGLGRVLQDQRTLQIPGTVQSGGQPEVSFEQRTRLAKAIEHGISSDWRHLGRVYLLQDQNIRPRPSVLARA